MIWSQVFEQAQQALQWFVFGPGAGYITYRLIKAPVVSKKIDGVRGWAVSKLGLGKKEAKRVIAFGISWALSLAGYGVMLALGMADPTQAVSTAVSLAGASTVTSQLAHGRDLDEDEEYQ